MPKINKNKKKINNGLRQLILREFPESTEIARFNYAQAVVDRVKEVDKEDITRNQVYLLVNDYTRLTPENIHIAKALKYVLNKFKEDKNAVLS